MKKLITLILVLCMAVSLFSGCGFMEGMIISAAISGNDPIAEDDSYSNFVIEDEVDFDYDFSFSDDDSDSVPATDHFRATLEETVVYDDNDIKITATGLEFDDWGDLSINFLVENNTDKNIVFSGDYFLINGITVSDLLYIEVAAGKKANGSLDLYSTLLEEANITELATLVANDAHVFDSDSYDDICKTPFSLETSAADTYTQALGKKGDLIHEEDGVSIYAYFEPANSENYTNDQIHFLVTNNSGKTIRFEGDNVSVNGYTIDSWLYGLVFDGSIGYATMDFYSFDLVDNGIETIEEITFTVEVMDYDMYDIMFETDEIVIKP